MELGKYADGRALNYDDATKQFDVGGAPVTNEDVAGYVKSGQVEWLTDDLRSWAQSFESGQAAQPEASAQVASQPTVADGKGLFGFRSRTPWKMVVAGAYYLFAVIIALALITTRKPYATSGMDIAAEVISGILMSLALLSPAFLMSDFGYRDKLPLFNKRKVIWSAAGLALFLVLMMITSAVADGLHTAPYKVASAKEAAERKAEADKKAAAEAEAKAEAEAESKKSAEASAAAEAKRVADTKAAEAKRVADAKAAEAASAAAADASAKPKPAAKPAPQTKADYLKKVIVDELGAKTNMDGTPKIREIADSGGDAYWLVRLNGNENLTNEMTKKAMWIDTKDVWARVFTERDDIDELAVFWYYPLVDAKGNTTDEIVMKLWMTKQNASDVKWDNVLIDNIPVIADDYWESPVFRN